MGRSAHRRAWRELVECLCSGLAVGRSRQRETARGPAMGPEGTENMNGSRIRRVLGSLLLFGALIAGPAAASGAEGSQSSETEFTEPLQISLPQAPDIPEADVLSNRLATLSTRPRFEEAGPQGSSQRREPLRVTGRWQPAAGRWQAHRPSPRGAVRQPQPISALEDAGADILFVSRRYKTVDLAIAEQRLRDLAGVPGVESVVGAAGTDDQRFRRGLPNQCRSSLRLGDLRGRHAATCRRGPVHLRRRRYRRQGRHRLRLL